MRRVGLVGAVALMLAGCGHLPFGRKAVPLGGEMITYTEGASIEGNPAYSVILGPDGQGIFTGLSGHGVVLGDHRFQATPKEVRSYQRALRPMRPNGERLILATRTDCGRALEDGAITSVQWQAAGLAPARLVVYGGCTSALARQFMTKLLDLPYARLPLHEFLVAH